ncbi:unnamed protein product, partial [Iphiclides podalirius]
MAALVYSILAVPTHIYLMWNASVFIVVNLEQCTENLKRKCYVKILTRFEQTTLENSKENSTYEANSDTLKKLIPCNKFFVIGYVRILYGFYVEGAMFLVACALANIRRLSSSPVACMSENYRLFHSADCIECNENLHRR